MPTTCCYLPLALTKLSLLIFFQAHNRHPEAKQVEDNDSSDNETPPYPNPRPNPRPRALNGSPNPLLTVATVHNHDSQPPSLVVQLQKLIPTNPRSPKPGSGSPGPAHHLPAKPKKTVTYNL